MNLFLTTFLPGHACVVSGSSLCNFMVSGSMPKIAVNVAMAATAFFCTLNPRPESKSSRSYQLLAQIHNAKGDKATAIKDLEKAVEIDPNNAQAKAQLQQLKGGA